jgi:hypothetical protein
LIRLTTKLLERALSNDPWGLGNQVLYDLCARYPNHTDEAEIVAKIWLIGRSYAAAIERGRGQRNRADSSNDRFYTEDVVTALRSSSIDEDLKDLRDFKTLDDQVAVAALVAHGRLMNVFRKLTNKNKRSLASKYLHFHRPHLFFIYDSRAVSGIRKLGIPPNALEVPADVDHDYGRFVTHAIGVRDYVLSKFGRRLSCREVDRVLLATVENSVSGARLDKNSA